MEFFHLTVVFYLLVQGTFGHSITKSDVFNRIVNLSDVPRAPYDDDLPVNVSVEYFLVNIQRADIEHNELELLVWMALSWRDKSLSWTKDCTSFKQVHVPAKQIWIPTIAVYKSVGAPETYSSELVTVSKDGQVLYMQHLRVRILCDLSNMTSSSNVGATCSLKSGPWPSSTDEVVLSGVGAGILVEYMTDSKFQVLNATQVINRKKYDSSSDTFEDSELKFSFKYK
ncbi:hypothetical protein Btru_044441 [Bulinus truncatus]|nr:hypothetical protein Btru_044441 [Bulinus truncatus]